MKRALVLTLAVALAACTTAGPDYRDVDTTAPAAWGELQPGGLVTNREIVARWWTTFRDPTLDSLVERAVRANPELRGAQARVREARAQRGIVSSAGLPSIDAAGGASRSRISDNLADFPGNTSNLFDAGFDALWEIDVFGGVARDVEAADADVAAAVADKRDVLITLLAEVARNYVDLRAAQRQGAIAHANLAAQRETLDVTRQRRDAGLASDLDVARAEALVEFTASAVPTHETSARLAVHALSVLLAEPPTALAAELSQERAIPAAPQEVPAGLPSDLLRRRPDVRRSERKLAAATARIGVATADLFPKFSLTGALGLQSAELHDLLDGGSRAASLGGAVRWPVLDFGRVRSNIEVQTAREEQAAAEYETTVLRSLREVEDALVSLERQRARRTTLAASASASRRAVELANQLWTAGNSDFLNVLQAQRDLFATESLLVQSDALAASDLVALYKALGGGWDVAAPAAGDAPERGVPGNRVLALR